MNVNELFSRLILSHKNIPPLSHTSSRDVYQADGGSFVDACQLLCTFKLQSVELLSLQGATVHKDLLELC